MGPPRLALVLLLLQSVSQVPQDNSFLKLQTNMAENYKVHLLQKSQVGGSMLNHYSDSTCTIWNPRGILELAGAIKCSTGRTPLAYLRYGCYCGLGGQGWPKDKVDWCCFKHDCCYSKAEQAGCQPKMESYNWECEDNAAVCDSLEDKCQKIVCECDRKASKCLAKAPYQPRYIFWPDFVCGESHPKCKF